MDRQKLLTLAEMKELAKETELYLSKEEERLSVLRSGGKAIKRKGTGFDGDGGAIKVPRLEFLGGEGSSTVGPQEETLKSEEEQIQELVAWCNKNERKFWEIRRELHDEAKHLYKIKYHYLDVKSTLWEVADKLRQVLRILNPS